MSSGRRKREQQMKEQERQKKRQLKDEFQHNPSGGSKYAKKGDKPFAERVAAEADRRIAEQASRVGAPVDETADLLSGMDSWAGAAFGFDDYSDADEAQLMREIEKRTEARQGEDRLSSYLRRYPGLDR